MNISQDNRFTRLKKVRAMLDRYRADWQNEPAIVKAVDQLDNEIIFIGLAANLTGGGTKHVTQGKNAQRELLNEKILWLSAVLFSWADDENQEEIKSLSDRSLSDFRILSAPAFMRAFQVLVDKAAEEGVDSLGAYGLDADKLESYQILAGQLDALLGVTQLSVSELKGMRKEISIRLSRVRLLLTRRLRKLLVPFKSRNSQLWNAFEAAMVIVDRKAGHPPSVDVDDVVVG